MNEFEPALPVTTTPAASATVDNSENKGETSSGLKDIIANHPFFSGIRRSYIDVLAVGATQIDIPAGQQIFREGEPATDFYLLLSGKIALDAHDPGDGTVHIQDLGPGDVLGWSWLFPPFAWHFSARTLAPTKLIALRGGHLLVTAEEDPKFGYQLMKRIAQVVIQRLQAARKELLSAQIESLLKG